MTLLLASDLVEIVACCHTGAMEGRSLDWSRVRFLTSVSAADAFPSLGLPHIAVAGHSNVGKSSLLNALFGRKGLVRTSKQPGCTRLLNVFEVAGGCVVVDLPGYGFARAGKQEQRRWRRLIEDYLRGNRELALVLCLLDMRHGPKASDLQLIEWLNAAGIRWLPVATKADKLSGNARAKRLGEMRAALGGMLAPIATSATTGFGIQALRDALVRELHACLAMP